MCIMDVKTLEPEMIKTSVIKCAISNHSHIAFTISQMRCTRKHIDSTSCCNNKILLLSYQIQVTIYKRQKCTKLNNLKQKKTNSKIMIIKLPKIGYNLQRKLINNWLTSQLDYNQEVEVEITVVFSTRF